MDSTVCLELERILNSPLGLQKRYLLNNLGRGCQHSILYEGDRGRSFQSAYSSIALRCAVSSINGDQGFRRKDTRQERFSRVC
jgi:hypothetical protein